MLIILLKKNRRKSPISINYRGFAQEIKYHTLNLQGTTTRLNVGFAVPRKYHTLNLQGTTTKKYC